LDQLESTTPGKKLPLKIRKFVRMSNAMVIVGSKGAGLSESVTQEIEVFLNYNKNKPLIPISFDDGIENIKWFKMVEGLPMCPEDLKNLVSGQPSTKVLDRIEKSLDFTKKSKRIRRISIFVFIVSLVLMGISSYFSFKIKTTQDEMEIANKALNTAKNELSDSRKELETKANQLTKTEDSLENASINLQTAQLELDSTQNSLEKVNDELIIRQDELNTVRAFEGFRQGNESLQANQVDLAEILFADVIRKLNTLNLNPLIALHAQMRRDFSQIDAVPIAPLNGPASLIRISKNKEQVLVIYDYQSPNGDPDIEDIPDWSAFEIYDIATGNQLMSKPIKSDIGSYMYHLSIYDDFEFEAAGHIVFKHADHNERYSLHDGTTKRINKPELKEVISSPTTSTRFATRRRLFESQTSDENLYIYHPDDGIDEYSPRLVDNVIVESPDGRTAIAGTYEGNVSFFDLNTGLSLGRMKINPVFDIQYSSDSKYILIADERQLWRVNTQERPSVQNVYIDLIKHKDSWKRETVLETALSEDGNIITIATTHRLLLYNSIAKIWREWKLPQPIKGIAAMNVNPNLGQLIAINKKGTIFRVKYGKEEPLEALQKGIACEVVGWIATDHSAVWLTCQDVENDISSITKIALTTNNAVPEQIEVSLANYSVNDGLFSDFEIRGLAFSNNRLFIIYGEPGVYATNEIIPEQLLVIPLNKPNFGVNTTLFEGRFINSPVDAGWTVNQINKIQYVDDKALVGLSEVYGSYVITLDGNVQPVNGKIGARQISFSATDAYNMGVSMDENTEKLTLSVNHVLRDVRFEDVLPWKFIANPEFANFSEDGRKMVIGNKIGDFLIIDVSDYEK